MDRELLKRIIRLTVPSVIEYTLQTLMNYADYIMVGSIGVAASAAIGLTTEVTWLLKGTVSALGIGVLAYISSAIGGKKTDRIKAASVQAIYTSIIIGIVMTVVSLVISPFVPKWLGADDDIAGISSRYFAISNAPFLFLSLNMVLGYALKAAGDMKTPLYVNGTMNIFNIIFNWLLIYPDRDINVFGSAVHIEGADLGIYGAALGTAISTVLGGLMMIAGFRKNSIVSPSGERYIPDREIISEFIRVGIPSMLTRLTSSGGRVIFTGIVAHLGTIVYSSHTISFTAESAFYIPCVGMMSAVSAMAGTIKGECDLKKLNRLTKIFCIFAASVMLVMSIFMFIFADEIICLFTNDVYVLDTAPKLLRIVALNEPLFAVSIVMESVFNGIGKTKLPFIAGTVSQWVFRVVGSLICLNVFGLGIEAAWICMILDNIFRCILLCTEYIFLNKGLIPQAEQEVSF